MAQDKREPAGDAPDPASGPNEGGGAWTTEHEGRASEERHAAHGASGGEPSGTYRGMAGSQAHGVVPTGEANVTAAMSREPDPPPVTAGERPARLDTPELSGQYYVVEIGDTLPTIAERFYGRAEEWERIAEVNREVIGEDGSVYPGQEILIPD